MILQNGILRNGFLRNGILRNGILRNGILRNGRTGENHNMHVGSTSMHRLAQIWIPALFSMQILARITVNLGLTINYHILSLKQCISINYKLTCWSIPRIFFRQRFNFNQSRLPNLQKEWISWSYRKRKLKNRNGSIMKKSSYKFQPLFSVTVLCTLTYIKVIIIDRQMFEYSKTLDFFISNSWSRRS